MHDEAPGRKPKRLKEILGFTSAGKGVGINASAAPFAAVRDNEVEHRFADADAPSIGQHAIRRNLAEQVLGVEPLDPHSRESDDHVVDTSDEHGVGIGGQRLFGQMDRTSTMISNFVGNCGCDRVDL